ncbi:MAG: hypothetical protein KTR26_12255 [Flammeovirgaceae bacterium]|nr:hypothetical protein [Flammeovirgaceae bacterium]
MLNKSKATVYEYFKTKEELLDFIISERLKEIRKYYRILNILFWKDIIYV